MIQCIWMIIIILYGSCHAQSKGTADVILWCNDTAEPHFPSYTQVTSIKARLQEARNDFITKAKLLVQREQQKALIAHACIRAGIAELTDFFEQCRSQGAFSDSELLTWYQLYQASSYRCYVKKLPGYEQHIIQLHDQFSKDKKVRKKAAKKMGLSLESAQKLVDHLWKELQHDRAALEAHTRTQAALHEHHEQLAILKSSQERVLQSQMHTLDCCLTKWRMRTQDSSDLTSRRYERRIQSSHLDNWYERSYHLAAPVTNLLAQHNISPDVYVKIYGNDLQHTLHAEFVSILERVAFNTQYRSSDRFFNKLNRCALECADIGCAYNKEGAVACASMIADIGWNILDLATAVKEAVCDATINTIDLVMHPLETLCAIKRGVFYFVASTGDGFLYQDTDYHYVPQSKDAVLATYNAIGRHLLETACQMKARDWVKSTVCFATECVLQAKLFKALAFACKSAGNYALRCAQLIEISLPEVKAAVAGAEGITTEIKLGETITHVAQQEERLFNLIKHVDGTYRSPAGLIYGKDSTFGNRIYHVLEHTKEILGKKRHTVFNVKDEKLFSLIDEAWLRRGAHVIGDPCAYEISCNKIIGTREETTIRIVVNPGTTEVLTAYPM